MSASPFSICNTGNTVRGRILFFRITEHGILKGIRQFDFYPGDADYRVPYEWAGLFSVRRQQSMKNRSPATWIGCCTHASGGYIG